MKSATQVSTVCLAVFTILTVHISASKAITYPKRRVPEEIPIRRPSRQRKLRPPSRSRILHFSPRSWTSPLAPPSRGRMRRCAAHGNQQG